MAKNTKQKVVQNYPQQAAPKSQASTLKKAAYIHPWFFAAFISLVAILIYANTFSHRFVLDDHGIIKNNKITKAPISWENTKTIFSTPLRKGDFSDLENSLYRPFVKFLFNIEWNVFDQDANKFHIVNVLLYALCGVFIFFIFYDIQKKKWVIPFLISLLFVTHPIHTEVVANIKSGDEVLSLLGVLIAIRCIQLYIDKNQMLYFILAVLGYLIGSFSKESTIVALAIFPVFIYLFTNASHKKNIVLSTTMLACSLFFLFCRYHALKGYPPPSPVSALDNYMVMCDDPAYAGTSKFASAVNTLGMYVRTFVFPHPLSCDYSFSTLVPVKFSNPSFLFYFLCFVAMFVFCIKSLWPFNQKGEHKHAISFGFLWFFISMSITSNIFFLIGTSFGERLFFVPSLGLIISLVYALAYFFNKEEEHSIMGSLTKSPVLFGVVMFVSVLYSAKTISRNKDWRSDFALFSKDVENYPESTHLLFYMGNHLSGSEFSETLEMNIAEQNLNIDLKDSVKRANYRSIDVFNKALSIYPALPSDGYNQLGKAYFNIGNIDSAYKYYMKAYSEDSTNPIFTNNLGTAFYNASIPLTTLGAKYQSEGRLDSANYYIMAGTEKLLSALPYFMKAHKGDTTEADFINNIGCIYGATQRPDSAIYWFKKASEADPQDITSLSFLDITYRNMGKIQEADFYKKKAVEVKAQRMAGLK